MLFSATPTSHHPQGTANSAETNKWFYHYTSNLHKEAGSGLINLRRMFTKNSQHREDKLRREKEISITRIRLQEKHLPQLSQSQEVLPMLWLLCYVIGVPSSLVIFSVKDYLR